MTKGQSNELQILRCTGKGGSFYLFFQGNGVRVNYDATVTQLNAALKTVKGLGKVQVTYTAGTTVCNSNVVNAVLIEFTQVFGP